MTGPTYRAVATVQRVPGEPEATRVETAPEHLRKAERHLDVDWPLDALLEVQAAIRALEGKS